MTTADGAHFPPHRRQTVRRTRDGHVGNNRPVAVRTGRNPGNRALVRGRGNLSVTPYTLAE
ncbi:hypothetical protein GCM10009801_06800 [Streptomyces albiaxialis]|uniref:Uncharacterized protein n=1 Tax=Streptomyces albiaxialis TaxID=329523 RepID=A0ABP5H2A5_9ACTN